VHLISGSLRLNGEHLGEGDGATVKADDRLELTGDEDSEALVFDLP
jgi:redox-sensitive bicupin YhaK (pirin superfamily)